MSSKKKPQLLGPNLEVLPRLEGNCISTNSDCGAKNTAEHASEGDSTTVGICEPSQPGNTNDFVKKQAFGDSETSQRHLRNITNQISLGPSPIQPKESAKEHASNEEQISKNVDRLLEELSHELDKLLNLPPNTLDSDEFNLSSDEEDLDETYKGKASSVASGELMLTPEQLKSKKDDRVFKEMDKEVSMGFGLAKATAKSNETISSNDVYDPENANREAHNRSPGKMSNNSTCEPLSTSEVVQSAQKLAATGLQSNCEAPSTSKGVLPSKKLTEAGLENGSKPSSSLDVPQTLYKLPASRFKAVVTETDETVSMTGEVKKKGDEEKEANEGEKEEKKKEAEEDEEEVKFVKPPNWLDPLLLRSVPELKKETNPTEPCPDTFFGKLHRNSPLAYTGHEKEPLDKKKQDSAAAREVELLQAAEQEVKKGEIKEQISCSSKEKELKAVEEALGKQETMNSPALEEQSNEEEKTLEKPLENREMLELEALETAQEENNSHGEDASGMKEVKEVKEVMNAEELTESLSSLEVPHSQSCPPVVKTISAREKDTLESYSQDSLPVHSQDAPSSHVKDSISSPSKNTPPSPNQHSPRAHSKSSSLYSQDSLPPKSNDSLPSKSNDSLHSNGKDSLPSKSKDYPPLHSKDSGPAHSKKTAHSTTTDYPVSLSKDSPPSHSRASPSHSTDYVPPLSKDSLPSHSKDAASPSPNTDVPPSSPNSDSRPSHCKDFPPHGQSFLPIQPPEKIIEQYDPEFPALVTPLPIKELNVGNLDMLSGMPTARASHLNKWLYSQSFLRNEYEQKGMEDLPEYSLIQYSDDEEETEDTPEREGSGSESAKDLDALQKGLQSLQLNEAIPECCLTDSVFLVDKPQSAVSQGFELPAMPLEEVCPVKNYLKIRVTHVYTPFQFWFNLVNRSLDSSALLEMQLAMGNFYNDCSPDYLNALPRCLIKAGYLCSIRLKDGWRRARILATSPQHADSSASIYYLDYGYGVDVPAADLRYLPKLFGEMPALAVRGTLSHIHPLGPHWSPDSMQQFQRLVNGKELFAHIMELDLVERIVFLRISLNEQFVPSVNRMLVDANLAARSQHYNLQMIENNFGRRPRYLRERLPSHEMLETGVFPVLNNEFEVAFDGIIYSPCFEKFMVPRLKRDYAALRQALVAWMPSYRKEMEEWAVLWNEAKTKVRLAQCKVREVFLLREERKRIEQARNRLTQKMEMLEAHKPQEMGTAEEKEVSLLATREQEEALKATQVQEEALKATQEQEEALKATQEQDEALRATQEQEEALKATQEQEEALKATQEQDEALRATQEDEETITATDDEDTTPQAGNMEEVD